MTVSGRPLFTRLHRLVGATLVATLALVAGSGPGASAQGLDPHGDCPREHRKLDSRLHRHADDDDSTLVRVIVRVKPGARSRLRGALAALGGKLKQDHALIEAITLVVPQKKLAALAARADVDSISEDATVQSEQVVEAQLDAGDVLAQRTMSDTTTPVAGPRHLRDTLGLTTAWDGTGIGVAIIDSGIVPVPDLAGRIRAFYDFTQSGAAVPPSDDYGHGTHVAGLIGGAGKATPIREYEGVAPRVQFIGLKVLDANGSGQTSNVIAAIEFATANRAALGIDVINLSLGHRIYEPAGTDPLVQAVEAASRAGIIVVVSAGNQGVSQTTGQTAYAGITSPGNAPSAITVGALKTKNTVVRSDDRVAEYSSRGPTWYDARVKPDLVAPGDKLVASMSGSSTLWKNYPSLQIESGYAKLSGTSMAAGVVSGSVALMLQAHRSQAAAGAPALTPNAVKAALQYTAVTVRADDGTVPLELIRGAGGLNTAAAVQLARAIDTTRPVGTPWLNLTLAPSTNSTVIGGETLAWGSGVIWRNAVVWGNTIDYNLTAWSDGVVWGNSDDGVVWGNNDGVVWGNSDGVVWGNTVVWGNAVVWGNSVLGESTATGVVWGNGGAATAQTVVWGNLAGQ